MILNQAQAEAVYSAMCALNRVRSRATHIDVPLASGEEAAIVFRTSGDIAVWQANHGMVHAEENYESKGAFATAYGLTSDEPQSAVAAAAGGLQEASHV